LPKDEIPRPARLKAPAGVPAQEANVVWHQLLATRHLLGLKNPSSASASATGATVAHRPFAPQLLHIAAAGSAPMSLADVRPTAARVTPSKNMPLLVGGPLGGVLAISAAAAGAFAFRRRRRAAIDPSS
jgi:hypothetical protein